MPDAVTISIPREVAEMFCEGVPDLGQVAELQAAVQQALQQEQVVLEGEVVTAEVSNGLPIPEPVQRADLAVNEGALLNALEAVGNNWPWKSSGAHTARTPVQITITPLEGEQDV